MTPRVRIGDREWAGEAIDLRGVSLAPDDTDRSGSGPATTTDGDRSTLAAAVACDDPVSGVRVDCRSSGPVQEHAGHVHPEMSISPRAALAAAARSRGLAASQDDTRRAVRERLADGGEGPAADADAGTDTAAALREARRRVAEASEREDALSERVARLAGRVQTLRERDADPSDAEAERAAALRELSEVRTERVAAEQALETARRRARDERRRHRDRLRLEDRAARLARDARAELASAVAPAVDAALAARPWVDADATAGAGLPAEVETLGTDGDGDPDVLTGIDPVDAALCVARVASRSAPVVVAAAVVDDCFTSPRSAADWLDTPVIVG